MERIPSECRAAATACRARGLAGWAVGISACREPEQACGGLRERRREADWVWEFQGLRLQETSVLHEAAAVGRERLSAGGPAGRAESTEQLNLRKSCEAPEFPEPQPPAVSEAAFEGCLRQASEGTTISDEPAALSAAG